MAIQGGVSDTQTHWEIDSENTSVEFVIGRFPIHRVRGHFGRVRGSAVTQDDAPDHSTIEVEMAGASIATGIKMRDGHLRNARFLDTERFPLITFRSTRVEGRGQDGLRVSGDLTIRDVTRQVILDATVSRRDGERAKVSATTAFDRRDFGIGPKAMTLMAGNDVAVRITLELRAQHGVEHAPADPKRNQ
jgi:polyisoprenoid-binding protein YceI